MPLVDVSWLPLRSPTIPPATHTTSYLVGSKTLLIVDPGSPYPREIQRLLDAVYQRLGAGGRVWGVFLTHHHPDHIGGAGPVASALGVPIMGHPRTLERLPATARAQARWPISRAGELALPGESPLQILHTPGHAAGHLCLFEPHDRWLIAGDMLTERSTVVIWPPEGNMSHYLASLDSLVALAPQRIYPGHGRPFRRGGEVIARLIRHRLKREERVLAALSSSPQALMQITRKAYPDVPARLLSLASRSTLAHLNKLVAERRARAAEDSWYRPS